MIQIPYIPQEDRGEVVSTRDPEDVGELTFLFTFWAIQYLKNKPYVRYEQLSEVIAAFDNAKEEFRRRLMSPYENVKIAENGDMFDELRKRMKIDGSREHYV